MMTLRGCRLAPGSPRGRASDAARAAALDAAAREAFVYLSATDPLPDDPADAVIGFGTFDLSLAEFCGRLYVTGRARRILFTGGIGAGTADLGEPEADAWSRHLRRCYPAIPGRDVLIENRSTNTAENIRYTAALLARRRPPLRLGTELRRVLVVASPARLRRVGLTLRHLVPAVALTRCLPQADFDRERAVHDSRRIPFLPHLAGELDRIVTYPERGWLAAEPLPERIARAHHWLRMAPPPAP